MCVIVIIEKMVNELMEDRREEFMRSTNEMTGLAKESVSEGGYSYCNLNHLIKDIKMMSLVGLNVENFWTIFGTISCNHIDKI